ncbi:hypothetical protein J25TS5_55630 [Paenibacillus faecis]|uniref:hypothetical protein n=1 Tax=Paenibacillus faecis TaxID=862114 RepID=UPI001B1DA8F7|nr:hypothetical protein [Paenibacillus faecis]GIO88631.1 hypothetical protein J25TS5_55630 [Paenibacillus faecis]
MNNKFIIFVITLVISLIALFLLYGLLGPYNVSLGEAEGIVIIALCSLAIALLSNKRK